MSYQQGMQQPGFAPQYMTTQPGAFPMSVDHQYPPPKPGGYDGYHSSQPGSGPPPQQPLLMVPQGVPNCPRGLEYLTLCDKLLIQQQMGLRIRTFRPSTNNNYTILNSLGQKAFTASEITEGDGYNICGSLRAFEMKVLDNATNEVIHFSRPLSCQCCWCHGHLQTMDVFSPPGQLIGRVRQNTSFCIPTFSIENESGDTVLKIEGTCFTLCQGHEKEFEILSSDGTTHVGKIWKEYTNWAQELYTDVDNYSIIFPMDLDVRVKAVLIGAIILIDFMYFEQVDNGVRRDL